jgi:TonB family protein
MTKQREPSMRILLTTLLLASSAAQADPWLPVAPLDSGGSMLFVDTASIDRTSEPRKAWFKSVYGANQPIADGYRDVPAGVRSYRWESNLGVFNCTERTLAVSQSVLHDADNQVVGRREIDASALKFGRVETQSIADFLLRAVCPAPAAEGQPSPGLARITYVADPHDFYPSASKRRKEEGAPTVKICVDPTGKLLREPEVTDPSGFPDLDGAAIAAAKANRYSAGVQDGAVPPESCMKFRVKFAKATPSVPPKNAGASVSEIGNPLDFYPAVSKVRKEQGTSIVKACVGPSGTLLREPEIAGSSGFPEIDAAAIKFAKAARFTAGTEKGVPLRESCIKFKVKFVLNE